MKKNTDSKRAKVIVFIVFVVYILLLLWKTLIGRIPMEERKYKLELFWTYKLLLKGRKRGPRLVLQNILNVVAFIPFGGMMPCLLNGVTRKKYGITIITAVMTTLLIESCQLIFCLGTFELDDIICNTVGAALGLAMYTLYVRILRKTRSKRK